MKRNGILFVVITMVILTGAFVQPSQAGLIAYFSFENETPSGYTASGATWISGAGYLNTNAYLFDGSNDYLQANININPSNYPLLTMGAWVKTSVNTAVRQIISHDNGSYDRSVGIDNRGGGLGWSAFSGSGSVLGYRPVILDSWTFVAAVYDQATVTPTVMLYVRDANGVYTKSETGTLGSGWNYIRIGSNPSYGEFFKGFIDDVFIFNEALTVEQLNTLSLAAHPVPIPGALILFASGLAGLMGFRRK